MLSCKNIKEAVIVGKVDSSGDKRLIGRDLEEMMNEENTAMLGGASREATAGGLRTESRYGRAQRPEQCSTKGIVL
jgi:hypothetical protein